MTPRLNKKRPLRRSDGVKPPPTVTSLHEAWAMRWLDSVATGLNTMSRGGLSARDSVHSQEEWLILTPAAASRDMFTAGAELILDKNLFVEQYLPNRISRSLSEAERDAYRAPFRKPGEGRRPTLTWPRQIPVEGEPANVAAVVVGYSRWLAQSATPKLFINAEPGTPPDGPGSRAVQNMAKPH